MIELGSRHARTGRARPVLASLAATTALLLASCGGEAKQSERPAPRPQPAKARTALECLESSLLSPERYSSKRDEGVEKGVGALMTRGARAAELLGGGPGPSGVVIEYPSAADASRALKRARRSPALAEPGPPPRIAAFDRTLFIDYTRVPHNRRIVEACARHPDRPPPTP